MTFHFIRQPYFWILNLLTIFGIKWKGATVQCKKKKNFILHIYEICIKNCNLHMTTFCTHNKYIYKNIAVSFLSFILFKKKNFMCNYSKWQNITSSAEKKSLPKFLSQQLWLVIKWTSEQLRRTLVLQEAMLL